MVWCPLNRLHALGDGVGFGRRLLCGWACIEAEIAELCAEVRQQDAALDRAHNDMASSLEREGRLEVHCEELLASAKKSQKRIESLIAFSKAHLNASE